MRTCSLPDGAVIITCQDTTSKGDAIAILMSSTKHARACEHASYTSEVIWARRLLTDDLSKCVPAIRQTMQSYHRAEHVTKQPLRLVSHRCLSEMHTCNVPDGAVIRNCRLAGFPCLNVVSSHTGYPCPISMCLTSSFWETTRPVHQKFLLGAHLP